MTVYGVDGGRALVGQFGPFAGHWVARPVCLEGQPSWTLGQLWLIWDRTFARDTAGFIRALRCHDWSVLSCDWPASGVIPKGWRASLQPDGREEYGHVVGMGRTLPYYYRCDIVRGQMGLNGRRPGPALLGETYSWAYLWESGLRAMHVYTEAAGQWVHVATLPNGVWADLTEEMMLDIEARRGWLERAA
ncbi:hypothetical protein ACQEVC_34245 [Plantactinospora sp. CA-294935]|uniref:hypothetical protein n=1 Tax=Plantactinospora sp. CA-294935 TaxID=3240012 RepID=UPI003D902C4B